MKPTQEQVIAWAREAGLQYYQERRVPIVSLGNIAVTDLVRCATLAYEAGRKDENEAIAQLFEGAPKLVPSAMNTYGGCLLCGFVPSVAVEVIRARMEQ